MEGAPLQGLGMCVYVETSGQVHQIGSMDRKGSGRPVAAAAHENMKAVNELLCSQEENHGTHDAPEKIEENLGISTSLVRLVKRNELGQFKCIKQPMRDKGQKDLRSVRASFI